MGNQKSENILKVMEEIRSLSFRLTEATQNLFRQNKSLQNTLQETQNLQNLKSTLEEKSNQLDEKVQTMKYRAKGHL